MQLHFVFAFVAFVTTLTKKAMNINVFSILGSTNVSTVVNYKSLQRFYNKLLLNPIF